MQLAIKILPLKTHQVSCKFYFKVRTRNQEQQYLLIYISRKRKNRNSHPKLSLTGPRNLYKNIQLIQGKNIFLSTFQHTKGYIQISLSTFQHTEGYRSQHVFTRLLEEWKNIQISMKQQRLCFQIYPKFSIDFCIILYQQNCQKS